MRGMDGLRACRGAEAALMTAARSKPHREITNCFERKSVPVSQQWQRAFRKKYVQNGMD